MASDGNKIGSLHPGSLEQPPTFASRRPHAAGILSGFQLPPPPKNTYHTASQSSQTPTTISSIGNLLTPPSTIAVELDTTTRCQSGFSYQPSSQLPPFVPPYSIGPPPTEQSSQNTTRTKSSDLVESHGTEGPPVIPNAHNGVPPPPVFSNIHNPNGQLSVIGMHPSMMPGFNSGHAASMPYFSAYSTYGKPASNDRPFKCDQCPQSFNLNHDLKRHKRIHLAVKPFPCVHCDKSFSRKDALKRHILVKGCGKVANLSDGSKLDHSSPKTAEVEATSSVLHEPKPRVPTLPHLESQALAQRPTVSDKVQALVRMEEDDDPYTSSQEPTVSNIVKILERILDAAKKVSAKDVGEYIEAWTGLDLRGTDLLHQVCSPASFPSTTARTKAVKDYVHAVLVTAQWRDYVRTRNRSLSLGQSTKSTAFRGNIDVTSASTTSLEVDNSPTTPTDKELRLTAFPNSLDKLWFSEVVDRTIDAFLYRWNKEHHRWLQYRWDAACALYYCRLHIDDQRWKYLDWNGVELNSVTVKVLASSQANATEFAGPSVTIFDDNSMGIEERRRLQNRIAQRNYRKKLRARLFELEERANANPQTGQSFGEVGPSAEVKEQIDPEVMVYQDTDEPVKMSCICESSSDQRFIIACLKCGTWQHIACYYESARDYMDEHRCVQCAPRVVEPKVPSSKRPANVAFSVHSSSTEYRSKRPTRTLGAESSIGNYERAGSETAYTDPTIYNDHEWRYQRSIAGKEVEQVAADVSNGFDARELERVKEISRKDGNQSTNFILECPLSAVETDLGLPSTCIDLQAGSMSQIRIHMLRRHGVTIKHCDECSKDFLDASLFYSHHGVHCTDSRLLVQGITNVRQQWKELYTSLRQTMDVNGKEASSGSLTLMANTGLSTSLAALADPLSEEKGECVSLKESSVAGNAIHERACPCLSGMGASASSSERHTLAEFADKLPRDWEEIQDQLPDSYKWDIEYVTTHGEAGAAAGCWTCSPLQDVGSEQIPLTIAEAPVVLPIEHQWPPIGGVHPPPDPRPSALIDCRTEMPLETIRDVFLTFEGTLGFYVLISGLLQIIVSDSFDTTWASSHLPHKYGGLKVCYITNTMEPTMLQSNVATAPRTNALSQSQSSLLMSATRQARSGQSLQLNDFIEARVSSTSREKFAGKIGLKVEKDGQPYLIMSTHIITEAILSKSFFGLNRDPLKRLQEDWNKNAEIWAGNAKIGKVEKSYDQAAEYYPTGFYHDVTLIRPNATASIGDIRSPISDIGWLNREAWSSLRQQPSSIKILGPTDTSRAAKCIKCNLPSEAIIVGEGIFYNQTAAAGSKPMKNHDLSTWNRFVSRAVLYRVNPDFNPPNGYSGIALYADGTREDGTQGPGIVGFQSFVQKSDHPQKFNMPEGPHLERRLKEGRVAFYGAFQVPDEIRREYSIL